MLKSNEETFHVAGDPNHGGMGKHDFAGNALAKLHPVRYEGKHGTFLLEVDIFPDLGEGLMVVMICPRCRNGSRISGKNKRIEFDTRDKRLSVEPFECTWEMGDVQGAYTTLCRTRIGVYNNRAKDA
jgi:hypothetical protein